MEGWHGGGPWAPSHAKRFLWRMAPRQAGWGGPGSESELSQRAVTSLTPLLLAPTRREHHRAGSITARAEGPASSSVGNPLPPRARAWARAGGTPRLTLKPLVCTAPGWKPHGAAPWPQQAAVGVLAPCLLPTSLPPRAVLPGAASGHAPGARTPSLWGETFPMVARNVNAQKRLRGCGSEAFQGERRRSPCLHTPRWNRSWSCPEGGGSEALGVRQLPRPHTDQSMLIPVLRGVPRARGSRDAPGCPPGRGCPFRRQQPRYGAVLQSPPGGAGRGTAAHESAFVAPRCGQGSSRPRCTAPSREMHPTRWLRGFSCSIPAALPQRWGTIQFF